MLNGEHCRVSCESKLVSDNITHLVLAFPRFYPIPIHRLYFYSNNHRQHLAHFNAVLSPWNILERSGLAPYKFPNFYTKTAQAYGNKMYDWSCFLPLQKLGRLESRPRYVPSCKNFTFEIWRHKLLLAENPGTMARFTRAPIWNTGQE